MEFVDPHISSVKNNRAVLEEIKRLNAKQSCKHKGPYCTEFETEEDFELHNKLWHSNYVYTECPGGCLNRFLSITELKQHRPSCRKRPPTPPSGQNDSSLPEKDVPLQSTRQARKPDRFSPTTSNSTTRPKNPSDDRVPPPSGEILNDFSEMTKSTPLSPFLFFGKQQIKTIK